jgi:hypothetical protein
MSDIHMIAQIPKLAELREAVLTHSEKRKPKWGFRLAADIVMELQAQTVSLLSATAAARGYKQALLKFEGQAVLVDGAGKRDLERWRTPACKRTFTLLQFDGDPDWQLTFRSWYRPRNDDPGRLERLDAAILAALQDGGIFTKLTPERMLKPACMICGKGLTDPASMARWIGPECAATTSIRVFWERATTKTIEVPENEEQLSLIG